jgi:hypothetical protein
MQEVLDKMKPEEIIIEEVVDRSTEPEIKRLRYTKQQ